MNILVFNPGSSTLRYGMYQCAAEHVSLLFEGVKEKQLLPDGQEFSHKVAAQSLLQTFLQPDFEKAHTINAIGCRVVHGGSYFSQPTIITHDGLAVIRELGELAPLHNFAAADVIEASQNVFPSLAVIGVFDTAFHHTIPTVAATYALPAELSQSYHLQRYGFHGIAHQAISERLLEKLQRPATGTRLITCHLGSGASVCALKDGKSVDTSMGFTPLEGLVMGTRCGDIDAGILFYLLRKTSMAPAELATILNTKSGLLGLSQLSGDVRELEKAAANDDTKAELALDVFAYRVAKYIGSYVAVLEGVDAVAFSGGIGENSSAMRERICKKLGGLGVRLDLLANRQIKKEPFCISAQGSEVSAWVIQSHENYYIAKQSWAVVQKQGILEIGE